MMSNSFSHWTAVMLPNFQQKLTCLDHQTAERGAKLRFLLNTGWLPRHIYRWILNQGAALVRARPEPVLARKSGQLAGLWARFWKFSIYGPVPGWQALLQHFGNPKPGRRPNPQPKLGYLTLNLTVNLTWITDITLFLTYPWL